jgi:hypothetical protein
MEIDIITREEDRVKRLFKQMEQMRSQIKAVKKNNRPLFNGEGFLTDAELSARLSISRRSLQDWRDHGVIGYIKLGGKVIYRESDVEKLLRDNYHSAF